MNPCRSCGRRASLILTEPVCAACFLMLAKSGGAPWGSGVGVLDLSATLAQLEELGEVSLPREVAAVSPEVVFPWLRGAR